MSGGGHDESLAGARQDGAAAVGVEQIIRQLTAVEDFYGSLMRYAARSEASAENAEPDLGGRLLYAGELDRAGSALVTAANVAGAATLAATANADAQRQAVREGVVDFLVNSLDEALRILKNEIRKRKPVAVCVAYEPEAMEHEMLERGVQPDLLAETNGLLRGGALSRGKTRVIRAEPLEATQAQLAWGAADAPAQWMPMLDGFVGDCLGAEGPAARRWLLHAPRYLGRVARGVRVLRCSPPSAREAMARMRREVGSGAIGVPVWAILSSGQAREEYVFHPLTVPGHTP